MNRDRRTKSVTPESHSVVTLFLYTLLCAGFMWCSFNALHIAHIATFKTLFVPGLVWRGWFCNQLCNDKSLQILRLWTIKAGLPTVCLSQVSCLSTKHASTCLFSTFQQFPHIVPHVNSSSELVIYSLLKPMLTGRPAICTHAILIWRFCFK